MLLFEMIMIVNVTQRITYPAVWVIGVLHLVLSALADSYLDCNRIFSRIIPKNNHIYYPKLLKLIIKDMLGYLIG